MKKTARKRWRLGKLPIRFVCIGSTCLGGPFHGKTYLLGVTFWPESRSTMLPAQHAIYGLGCLRHELLTSPDGPREHRLRKGKEAVALVENEIRRFNKSDAVRKYA